MIYFASDFHLGIPDYQISLQREKLIVKWLDEIKNKAKEIYLMGDIFDFWHEWKNVVPKGYVRFFSKIIELVDSGIKINFITGNHDLWTYGYLEQELGMTIYYKPIIREIQGKKFFLAHGDGLGPKDTLYSPMKKVFTNKFIQWCFANLIHPNLAFKIAKKASGTKNGYFKNPKFKGEEEWLIIYARQILEKEHFDFLIFGHRHIPIKYNLGNKSFYVGLGDWLKNFSYAVFDGQKINILKFKE